jgi:hypothetical protein
MAFSAMPSGTGEVTPSRLSLGPTAATPPTETLVTVWLDGGIAGRTYTYKLDLTTFAGRVYEILIGQVCNPLLAANPIPQPVNPGFGTPITWPA